MNKETSLSAVYDKSQTIVDLNKLVVDSANAKVKRLDAYVLGIYCCLLTSRQVNNGNSGTFLRRA